MFDSPLFESFCPPQGLFTLSLISGTFLSCCAVCEITFRDFCGKGDIWEEIGLRPCSIVVEEFFKYPTGKFTVQKISNNKSPRAFCTLVTFAKIVFGPVSALATNKKVFQNLLFPVFFYFSFPSFLRGLQCDALMCLQCDELRDLKWDALRDWQCDSLRDLQWDALRGLQPGALRRLQ